MNEFFPTKNLTEQEKETLLVEILSCLFYLPPSILRREGVAAKSFKILPGEEAYMELWDLKRAGYAVQGEVSINTTDFARQVAISERSYKGKTYYVYRLWHAGHPAPAPRSSENFDNSNQPNDRRKNHEL